MASSMTYEVDSNLRRFVAECSMCHDVCEAAIAYVLQVRDDRVDPDLVRTLIDCSEVCKAGVDITSHGSRSFQQFAAAFSEVCERCAVECDCFPDDEPMRTCAEECRRCGRACLGAADPRNHGRSLFERLHDDWKVDEASDESFPASDPPGY